jgi:hypothetical protein
MSAFVAKVTIKYAKTVEFPKNVKNVKKNFCQFTSDNNN